MASVASCPLHVVSAARCPRREVCCTLSVACCPVERCLSHVLCCSMPAPYSLLLDVICTLSAARCLLHVVCRTLSAAPFRRHVGVFGSVRPHVSAARRLLRATSLSAVVCGATRRPRHAGQSCTIPRVAPASDTPTCRRARAGRRRPRGRRRRRRQPRSDKPRCSPCCAYLRHACATRACARAGQCAVVGHGATKPLQRCTQAARTSHSLHERSDATGVFCLFVSVFSVSRQNVWRL